MARALIVGCGCRGRELGKELLAAGWAVRGTSRGERGLEAIEAAGIEPASADPDRVGTVLELVGDVAVVVHPLGSASGAPETVAALHGPRLGSLMEKLVDTPVRGFVYEAAGTVDARVLDAGAEIVRAAGRTWRIPVTIAVGAAGEGAGSHSGLPTEWGPDSTAEWAAGMRKLALGLLSPARAS